MKFLIDECLSPKLVRVANDRGFEAYHVAHRGWSGDPNFKILQHLIDEELILVTNNQDDFLSLIEDVDIHPGIVVIVENVRQARQVQLFKVALDACVTMGDMINAVVEVRNDGTTSLYHLPTGQ